MVSKDVSWEELAWESLCSGTLSSTRFSLNSCSHSGMSEHNGSLWIPFIGFSIFIGLGFIRSPWSIINRIWPLHLRDVNPIFSFSSLNFTYCKWRRRGWRRWWAMTLLSWRCPWSWWRSRRRTWQAWNHSRNDVLRVAWNPNPVLNEMWFLTIDPFIGIPIFIAKLSKRQYCWRVIVDFQSQEYIQFFDIHSSLFMRLHFSIGGYDCRRTTWFRQGIHFSIIQVLFADHMHRRSGVHNKFSFLKFKSWCRQTPIFRRWEECCFIFSFNFEIFLASFHAASRAPCSCHSVSSWDRSSNFGALGLRWWSSPGQIYPSEGFLSRISVWRAIAFVNFTRWIGFCMSELFRKIDVNFGGFMSWNTQPNCRAFDDRRPAGPRLNS